MLKGTLFKEGDVIPQSGIDFAMVRLVKPDVRDGFQMDDQQVTQNRYDLAKLQIPVWAYCPYNYDETPTGWGAHSGYKQVLEWVKQAKKGLSKISGIAVGFHDIYSPDDRLAPYPSLNTFLANFENISKVILEQFGKQMAIYTTPSFIARFLRHVPAVTKYPLFLAHYSSSPNPMPWNNYTFLEYSDLDTYGSGALRFEGSHEELAQFALTGEISVSSTPTPTPIQKSETLEERVAYLESIIDKLRLAMH